MKTSLIEEYDQKRYGFVKGFTIAFMGWFALFILTTNFTLEPIFVQGVILSLELVAFLVWAFYLFKINRLSFQIKHDTSVRDALDNELIKHYKLKSSFVTLIVMTLSIMIFTGISSFVEIATVLVCEILLYLLISSFLIAFLVYYKN